MKRNSKFDLKKSFIEIAMIILSLIMLFPLIYMFLNSFKTKVEIAKPLAFPSSFYFDNYRAAFIQGNFLQLFINSVIVTFSALAIIILIGSMAGYVLGREKGKFSNSIYIYFLSGMMIPFIGSIIPLYQLIKATGLTDHLILLVLLPIGGAMPMAILIYAGFIKTVPRELEESAFIDGSGKVSTFFRIVFPLLIPSTVAVVITSVVGLWNDFMGPLFFISSENKRTLAIGIYTFMSDKISDWGAIYALTTLSSIPLVIIFLFTQKYFYKGITSGAIKS